MTIKNTRKNISAEPDKIVTNVTGSSITLDANNANNFSSNLILTINRQSFFDETNPASETKNIVIPLKELIRLKYLEANYYNKTYINTNYYTKSEVYNKNETYSAAEIDSKIKLHYIVVSQKPTVAEAREKSNYIFLVPFANDNANGDNPNDTEQDQEGHYIEYIYVPNDGNNNEKVERIGSTKLDLTPYLKIANFDNILGQSSLYTSLLASVTSLQSAIETKLDKIQTTKNGILTTDGVGKIQVSSSITTSKISDFAHQHGNISFLGTMENKTVSPINGIAVTNSSKQISAVSSLPTSKIISPALPSLRTGNNASLDTILSVVDEVFGNINTNLSNYAIELSKYELKSDLHGDVWGGTGFQPLFELETNPNVVGMKLGEYIYYHLYQNFYTKSQIDTLIASTEELLQETLLIL